MKVIRLELESCYGIRKLKADLDYSDGRALAIYAPNGSMKTSLAKTLKDLSTPGSSSKDQLFPARPYERNVTDENGTELKPGSVFVISPYDETFSYSEKTSTLLVNPKLKSDYDRLHRELDNAKESFLKALKAQSGSKKDLEKEISLAFSKREDKFYQSLVRIAKEVEPHDKPPLATIRYDSIFDERIVAFLGNADVKAAIKDYIERYDQLIQASTYFKKGVFNYYNASTIAKNLEDNGFFSAKHYVTLNGAVKTEISTRAQLVELIDEERKKITEDDSLKKKFDAIETQMNRNAELREFHRYLLNNLDILPRLDNLELLKDDLWKAYFSAQFPLYKLVLDKYEDVKTQSEEIEATARAEQTQWEDAIELFNRRFVVPFVLQPKNKAQVMLGHDRMLTLDFTFKDGADTTAVQKDALLRVLSSGEKKALYLLNIIFEVEVRKKSGEETLLVFDDIADSFDYKNKYAIIEYLKEMIEVPNFVLLLLTHNFDFFRTVQMRQIVPYSGCRMIVKDQDRIELKQAEGIQNVFVNDLKVHFFDDRKKKIASIPFMRNIIEYTKGDKDANYLKLTSLLHWKQDSESITVADLGQIYTMVFDVAKADADGNTKVVDLISQEAKKCLGAPEGINFENKIVLSIAIRLAAERLMIKRISDPAAVAKIDSNQTGELFKLFKAKCPGESKAIETMGRVVLMTPESIHLNSFMYEPILDMSDRSLRRLYEEVSALG